MQRLTNLIPTLLKCHIFESTVSCKTCNTFFFITVIVVALLSEGPKQHDSNVWKYTEWDFQSGQQKTSMSLPVLSVLDASVFKTIFISQQQLAIWNAGRRHGRRHKQWEWWKVFYVFRFSSMGVNGNDKMISFDLSLDKSEKMNR